MRKPSLSLETFVAALTVLGATASVGCSKASPAASAAPEPPAAAAAPASPAAEPAAQSSAPAAPAPLAAPSPADEKPGATTAAPPKVRAGSPVGATAVDAGATRGAAAEGEPKKDTKGSMSCGAGGCSPDMKKGNGN